LAQSEQPEMEKTGSPVEITRYPNRRLYDRSQGRYVTLPEIEVTIRQGKTVVVRDSKSGEDLTRFVMTQIILEHHPERIELLPVAVLRSMIQANAGVLGFLRDYFRHLLVCLEMLERSSALNAFVPPLDWMRFFLSNPRSPALTADQDTEALTRRVAELEKQLQQLNASAEKAGFRDQSAAHPG